MKNPVFIWNHRKHEEAEPEDVIGQAVAVDVARPTRSLSPSSSIRRRRHSNVCEPVRLGCCAPSAWASFPWWSRPTRPMRPRQRRIRAGRDHRGAGVGTCELSLTIVPRTPMPLKARSFTPDAPRAEVAAVSGASSRWMHALGQAGDSGLYTTPASKLNPGEAPEAAGGARVYLRKLGSGHRTCEAWASSRRHGRVYCFLRDVPGRCAAHHGERSRSRSRAVGMASAFRRG